MTRDLTRGSPLGLILSFTLHTLRGLLFQQFYNLVDTMIVGKLLGADALAAVGSTGSINFLVIGFCTGLCSGFAIPVAQRVGAGEYGGMRRYVANAAYLSALSALLLTLATALLCRRILLAMDTPAELFQDAYWYILIIFLGIPATILYNLLSGILRSLGDSRTPVYFLALSSVVNIGLDFALILLFRAGVAGAAVATVIAQGVSGLACLVDDEKEMGATVIDMGGGTTSITSFKNGHPIYFAAIPVGGNNVTNDIAYGLTTSFSHAERLKTLHGCAFLTSQDSIDTINVYPVGEEDDSCIKQIPRSELISIITPRIEETFEMVNRKLYEAGLAHDSSHRVVLTGGASQLPGVVDIAAMVLDKQVRLGKPKNILNLPDNLYAPSFATCVGMLLFAVNFSERRPKKIISKPISAGNSWSDNLAMWLKTLWG